jgi:hypothetical protein
VEVARIKHSLVATLLTSAPTFPSIYPSLLLRLNKWIWFSGKPPRYRAVEVFMLMSGVVELAFAQGGLHFSAAANPSVDVRPFNRHCSGNAITSCGSCWIVDQNLEL